MKNYLEINKKSWNNRTSVHLESEFYDVKSFLEGKSSLNSIELELLGNVEGKSILHLQCHFGQDTISLSRLGAKSVGVDLSDKAIEAARNLAEKDNSDARFICSDIYDLSNHLNEKFDIVFTSYGTIGWLPDLDKWAKVVSYFLKPQGKFVIVEFHPLVWMFDDDFQRIEYTYFKSEAIETVESTYTENAEEKDEFVSWNHGLGEVINSLISNSLEINSLDEYDYSPYNCFNKTEEFEAGKFRIKHLENKIPMVYSISATKI
ncbi:class I SAM-dependent methyltransferase [Moheibacter sediminis]|uniref:Methyltransferase domain-containing protein n=1 Tax=Moheibacter sediminis TaxID=1434700 RepID=A0A1W1Z1N2_9FLAO|nr:class I SAM-dependent methyltransferase [Moheibacter sediminis]SMC42222.1 Methyltransferase domain-containing protein [Moheibacter sediminis]